MEDCKDVTVFFAAIPSITTGYLARAVVNNVLKGGHFTMGPVSMDSVEDHCKVS